ncbi:hypothetical protein [Nitrososphaera sp. AFS]|uniref:hypothetical protein n=1 Tax=Nitrososphaera sp. AFS TaxID=2301191 RepID=UPI0013923B07|nr:hypothetical protein [Nitrososphaera sp. AFS]NAL78057.1 hypothetical protein [Nitrososphaera sp. AFS]
MGKSLEGIEVKKAMQRQKETQFKTGYGPISKKPIPNERGCSSQWCFKPVRSKKHPPGNTVRVTSTQHGNQTYRYTSREADQSKNQRYPQRGSY